MAGDRGALRERAERVLTALNREHFQRPLFVEFSGSPKSGKSTCIDIVAHFFRRLKFRVSAPTEGASKRTPFYLKDDLVAFNTWSASYALTHILKSLHHSDRYHLAILDRGLFDALVWFELLEKQTQISSDTRSAVHRFLLVDKWRSAIDSVLLFKADPGVSMERENKDKLVDEPGRAMNVEFLTTLNEAYDRVRREYGAQFPGFEVVDTTSGTTPQSTAQQVTELILGLFEARLQRGAGA